jgi:hypothetical protein
MVVIGQGKTTVREDSLKLVMQGSRRSKKNDRNTPGDCYYMKKSLVTFHNKYAWNKAIDGISFPCFRIKTNHHLNYSFVHPYQPWIKNPLGVYERGGGHRRSFFRRPG